MPTSAARAVARTAVLLGALAAVLLALLQAPTPAHAGPGEADITSRINAERARVGAAPLATRSDLVQVARAWAERMAREGRLYHNPALSSQVCCWSAIAENVGYTSNGASDMHRLFMESPPHRANLLNATYTEVGVGSAVDSRGRLWVTEVFRRPRGGAPPSAIDAHHRSLGGAASPLGAATSGELVARDGVGRLKRYTRGVIYWTPATGARSVRGAILSRWNAQNSELGPLRYPTTDELPTPDRVGRFNHFQGGSIYWTPRTGAHEVRGAIHAAWRAQGWETGRLGYPTTGEYDVPGGRASDFQGGRITWDRATGAIRIQLG